MPEPTPPSRRKLTGVCPPARGAVLAALARAEPAPLWLVVCPSLRDAEQLAEDAAFLATAFAGERPVNATVFPESLQDAGEMRDAFAASSDRLTVLSRLRALRGVGRTPDTLPVFLALVAGF